MTDEVAKAPPFPGPPPGDALKGGRLDGLGAAGRTLLSRFDKSGEDRLVYFFLVVSALVHAFVLLFGGLHWLREKPPLADEWTMDADLVNDLDLPPPTRQALPKAEKAPEPKTHEMLPQLPKNFAVKEPTKADEPGPVAKPEPKEAKPADQPKKVEEPLIKTENKDDNKMDQAEILKRAALERLRNQEKTAKKDEAPEDSKLAQLAQILEKNKKGAAGSPAAVGRINSYGAKLKRAIRQNYSLPAAYNLKGSTMKVRLAITISASGSLQNLEVRQSSNDQAFDELTMQAVRASAPFEKPPPELAGEEILLDFTPNESM